ncbi:MAG TPA: hypothetical protein PLN52_23940 [Opitutaceae bacterium]|nr:hypothetical protein [Opitutaceae bacterium]
MSQQTYVYEVIAELKTGEQVRQIFSTTFGTQYEALEKGILSVAKRCRGYL